MPHFISTHILKETNIKLNDFEIWDYCISDFAKLLPIKYQNTLFFLEIAFKNGNFIYKTSKINRMQNIHKLKEILFNIMEKIQKQNKNCIISHNLNSKQKHIINDDIPYFLGIENMEQASFDFIEIGFGSGRHILKLAKENNDKKILGIEIHSPSINQVLHAISTFKLKNLYICRADARIIFQILKSNSSYKIFLHFPIPWNKSLSRRVFSKTFLENAYQILRKNGILDIRSDDKIFVDSVIQTLKNENASFEFFKNKDIDIISKYEQRWKRDKKDIFDIHIYNDKEHNETKNLSFNFEFSKKLDSMKFLANLRIVQDSYFLNIGNVYVSEKLEERLEIAEISFGIFNMPFKTYLLLKNKIMKYLMKPLSVDSFINSHKLLCDAINKMN